MAGDGSHAYERHLLQLPDAAPHNLLQPPDAAPTATMPRPPPTPAAPGKTWVEPSHSCTIVMIGGRSAQSAGAPPRFSLQCSGGVGLEVGLSPWLDSARNFSNGIFPGAQPGR